MYTSRCRGICSQRMVRPGATTRLLQGATPTGELSTRGRTDHRSCRWDSRQGPSPSRCLQATLCHGSAGVGPVHARVHRYLAARKSYPGGRSKPDRALLSMRAPIPAVVLNTVLLKDRWKCKEWSPHQDLLSGRRGVQPPAEHPVCRTDFFSYCVGPSRCKNCSTGLRSWGKSGRNPPLSLMNTTLVP
jgi:hypothetical protein